MNRPELVKVGAGGAAIGLAAAYLFDPHRGRAHRAQLRDRTRAHLRRDARRLGKRAHYERGRFGGIAHRLAHPVADMADDRMLIDRVRSQALGRMPDLAHSITVDACNSVVTVRGQLDDRADIARVEHAIGRVPGVERVASLLHLPDEAAPNKADALGAGR
jgi:hypothetical protein